MSASVDPGTSAAGKPPPRWKPLAWGVGTAVVYGLGMRLAFAFFRDLELVSLSFVFGVPVVLGMVSVLVGIRRGQGWRYALAVPAVAVCVFLLACMALMLEGLICVVIMAPVYFVLSLLGGLLAWGTVRVAGWTPGRGSLPVVAALPLLLALVEPGLLPVPDSVRTVHTSLEIDAPPAVVWRQITRVRRIDPDEWRWSFVHWMGVPRPVRADMSGEGPGAVRTSHWAKGIVFRERITQWRPGRSMRYGFDIDPDQVPLRALDPHVRMGGEHYAIRDGGYTLQPLPAGRTRLTLDTTYVNTSQSGFYGNLWGDFLFDDFHRTLLHLMKRRAEAAVPATVAGVGEYAATPGLPHGPSARPKVPSTP